MSNELFDRSADLKRLREEGYCVEECGGFLLMRDVPYVGSDGKVRHGTLVSELTISGNQTRKPGSHQVHFVGDAPCDSEGKTLNINVRAANTKLPNGMVATHSFSSKPKEGYTDYHEKMTAYANILAGPASVVRPGISPKSLRVPAEDADTVFNYIENASDRVGIGELARKLSTERIAIVGLGGTGSYVLDAVVKTLVPEIHLFDDDVFLQHNAFRAPGAASLEQLREVLPKVEYFKRLYSPMRRGIIPHKVALDASNVSLLDGVTFAFLCMDAGPAKKAVVEKLESMDSSFIDVGMGIELEDESLSGVLRVTASTPQMRDHVHKGGVSFKSAVGADLYDANIQVAELNALNAMLAIVKWKQILGFYCDQNGDVYSTYTIDTNKIANGFAGS
ncbi:ThiF family adenylyltransferase [Novipirellula sp.]|uniref:ThiF family adenylyltransferase n=1 Tax=Novipirellula sp. TaxID=2795430 RepID=UPI0035625F84